MFTTIKTVYHDHLYLVGVSGRLHRNLDNQKSLDESRFAPVNDALTAKVSDLSQRCSKQEGISETLDKQNRGQQETINNCQTQALKLLTPEAFKMTPLMLSDEKVADSQTIKFIVLTNQVVTPVKMRIACSRQVVNASVWVVGSGTMAGGAGVLAPNLIDIGIDSPAWSTISPLLVAVTYTGPHDINCNFVRRYI